MRNIIGYASFYAISSTVREKKKKKKEHKRKFKGVSYTLHSVNRDVQRFFTVPLFLCLQSVIVGCNGQEAAGVGPVTTYTRALTLPYTHTHPSVRPGQEEKHFTENKREENRERVSKIKGKQAQL